jgi:hypothetical protein
MLPHMAIQITILTEASATESTQVRFLSCMYPDMLDEVGLGDAMFAAYGAHIDGQIISRHAPLDQRIDTDILLERPLWRRRKVRSRG